MSAAALADLVLALHLLYVGFVLAGFAAIVAGPRVGWGWVRRWPFRVAHLAAIGLVAVEAVVGWACPLTTLEDALRRAAGDGAAAGSFMGRLMARVLYYDLPPWVFTSAYLALTALAVGLLRWVPPRRRQRLR